MRVWSAWSPGCVSWRPAPLRMSDVWTSLRGDAMTQVAMGEIGELRAAMQGPVIAPGDPGFDEGRRVWNAQIDRRPSVIARCASAADVAAAIGFARERRLEISVRAGAHNTAGTAVCDDGLMVDLSLLNEVTVDPRAPAGTSRRRRSAGRSGRGCPGPRPGRARRAGQSHRRRGAYPGWRHGVADPQVRPEHRQPGLSRGGHRRRPGAAGGGR